MQEKTPDIYKKKELVINEGKEKIEPLADKDINEVNNLLKRQKSKENPLNPEEEKRLEELKIKRENEINRIFPEFSFETIAGLGEKTAMEKSHRQFESANRYFKSIAVLTYGDLYNMALYLEKLKSWDIEAKSVEGIFPNVYKKRQESFIAKHRRVEEGGRGSGYLIKEITRNELFTKLKSRKISSEEMNRLEQVIKKEELIVESKIPNYLRESVIYIPGLAKEVQNLPNKFFWLNTARRNALRDSILMHSERIDNFKQMKENLVKK